MCGIAGHIAYPARPDAGPVEELVRRIRHRGPDDQGIWRSRTGECVLGHARLSIIDLSPLGHQPMIDPQTGNSIVFNGEIYNFQSLRKACEAQGDVFRSHSDTEVILALYRRYGERCLDKLRGMFAFAIWDEGQKRVFFARDRVGKKPFHYAVSNGGFVFCSEIDPLSHHPGLSRELDPEALELYLQLQYIPAPWTIYKQIRKLHPAHYGVFDRNGLRLHEYWDVDYTRKVNTSEQDALDGLEEKLIEALRMRLIADVPLGALLSGGVDSSLVVALMAKVSGTPVHTFSIGFREEAFDELPFAQQAAERVGTLHHPEVVEGDVAHLMPLLARRYGEPYADSSAVPSFFVAEAARRHVTVALNGDGGDELLGGYVRYGLSDLQMLVSPWLGALLTPGIASRVGPRLLKARSLPMKAARKVLFQYMRPELGSVTMYSQVFNDDERPGLLHQRRRSDLLPRWREGWFSDASRHARHPIDRMLYYDHHTYLPGDLLMKMDIATMHCGLEARSPLLDHELIEYCAALPVRFKRQRGVAKFLLKKLAERYFPPEFVHRRKRGFCIPLTAWLRGPLRELLEDTLHSPRLMTPLDDTAVRGVLGPFLAGNDEDASRVWALLMFGLWQQQSLTGRA